MVSLITRMVSMEIVCSVDGDTFYEDFYGKISLEIVLGFHGENMGNAHTIYIILFIQKYREDIFFHCILHPSKVPRD